MNKYVALLRGINVGGNNIIPMSKLKDVFLQKGFKNVATYIQSGNVIFETDKKDNETITKFLEETLSKIFNYNARLIVISYEHLKNIVIHVPPEWKKQNDIRCYIAFVKNPITVNDVIKEITLKEEVDSIQEGEQVVYMTTKLSGLTKSGFSKLVGKTIYKQITIRNYNTSKKILQLMEQA